MSPGKPDAAVVRRHLLALDEVVQRLRPHTGHPLSALHDPDAEWAVERGLQLCAQHALDVATHLAVSVGSDVPDYASAIDVLAEAGVLPADFARRFRGIAGFRNVLVHGYLGVDLERVHTVLNSEPVSQSGSRAAARVPRDVCERRGLGGPVAAPHDLRTR